MAPQCFPIAFYLTVTQGSFSMDPPQGSVRLTEHGVVPQPNALVGSCHAFLAANVPF